MYFNKNKFGSGKSLNRSRKSSSTAGNMGTSNWEVDYACVDNNNNNNMLVKYMVDRKVG